MGFNKMIDDAVSEGIQQGFENSLAKVCDGYDDPEERCPMRPKDGCACLRHQWRKLTWLRKLFKEAPMVPKQDAVLKCYFDATITPPPPQTDRKD